MPNQPGIRNRQGIRNYPSFSCRIRPEAKKDLEEIAYRKRISMGGLIEVLVEDLIIAEKENGVLRD